MPRGISTTCPLPKWLAQRWGGHAQLIPVILAANLSCGTASASPLTQLWYFPSTLYAHSRPRAKQHSFMSVWKKTSSRQSLARSRQGVQQVSPAVHLPGQPWCLQDWTDSNHASRPIYHLPHHKRQPHSIPPSRLGEVEKKKYRLLFSLLSGLFFKPFLVAVQER